MRELATREIAFAVAGICPFCHAPRVLRVGTNDHESLYSCTDCPGMWSLYREEGWATRGETIREPR